MNLMEAFVKIGADTSDLDKTVDGLGSKLSGALGTAAKVGAAGLAVGTTAVIGFGKTAVDAGRQFDSAMSQVAATMGKPVDEINDLRDYAQKMGSATSFSATQAAEALNYMALAGYDANDSMEMLPNVLNLAAAGQMDLASASDMVTDAQSALGLSMDETTTMVDQMAKASSTTNTSVSQLGSAILTIGATARGVKGGTAELAQVLGLLADNGIKGAEGGTHLRNILLSLQTPTTDGAEALAQLGMSYEDMYDEAGNMKALPEIFEMLSNSMEGMTQQSKDAIISGIFNKTDLAAVNALVGTNKERWDEVAGAIADASGAAGDMANTQLDNLNGDITLFQSALEGAQIAISDKVTPTLRKFVQLGTKGMSDITKAFKEGGLSGAMGALGTWLSEAIDALMDMLPTIVDAGAQLLTALIDGISKNIPKIATAAVTILQSLVGVIIKNLPTLVSAGIQLIGSLAQGIAEAIPNLIPIAIDAVRGIGDAMPEGIKKYILPTFGSITAFLEDVFSGNWEAAWAEIINILKNAWEGITTFVQDIFTKIVELVSGIDWFQLGNDIVDFVMDGLFSLVESAAGLFGNAVDAILAIDWGDVGTKIYTFITDALGVIVEWATTAFENVTEKIKSIDWSDVGHQIFTWISEAIGAIVDWFSSSFNAAKDGVMNIDWLALGESIWEYIKSAFLAVVETFTTIFSDAWTAISQIDWAGLGSSIWDFIISAFNFVKEWATEKFEYIAQVIKEVDWLGVGNKIWDTIISAFNFVAKWAKEKFEFLAQKIKDVDWKGVGTFLWDTIKSGVTAVATWATKLGEKIADKVKEVDWKAVGTHLWNTIKSGVTAVASWALSVGREISDKIKAVDWEAVGSFLWDGIKKGVGYLVKGAGKVVAWAGNLAGEIKDEIISVDWEGVGDKIWSGIKTGVGYVTQGMGKVVNWATNLAGEIKDGLFTIDWVGAGADIWEGIKSAFSNVTDFFTNLLDFRDVPIKLPHITVTDWWDIGPVRIPWGFDVQWYKKAYDNPFLLKSPALLGGYGFGDRGAYQGGEMVYSHDKLMQDIREASRGDVTINVYQQPGEDAEELAERISKIFADEYSRRG